MYFYGGKATQKKAREAKHMVKGMLEASLKPLNGDETSRTEKRGEELTNKELSPEDKDWINAFEGGQSTPINNYLMQSRGY